LTATVPVNSSGAVNTSSINVTGASPPAVVCNTAANLLTSSVSGGVRNAAVPPPGFSNIIDYTGTASIGSTSSSVNTATVAGAAGQEDGNTAATTGAYTGNLAITVTPQAATTPLISGSYSDTLRVTITPQ
jgi:carbon monoxide dehydrogenase subunit G